MTNAARLLLALVLLSFATATVLQASAGCGEVAGRMTAISMTATGCEDCGAEPGEGPGCMATCMLPNLGLSSATAVPDVGVGACPMPVSQVLAGLRPPPEPDPPRLS